MKSGAAADKIDFAVDEVVPAAFAISPVAFFPSKCVMIFAPSLKSTPFKNEATFDVSAFA